MTAYLDCNGIPFTEYRKHLPKLASDFPRPKRVKDAELLRYYHGEHDRCQVCGRMPYWGVQLECHHITGGSKGRSDERTNIIMLCNGWQGCHNRVQSSVALFGDVLWWKWKSTPEEVDWVRLALLHGSFLPDLIEGAIGNLHRRGE